MPEQLHVFQLQAVLCLGIVQSRIQRQETVTSAQSGSSSEAVNTSSVTYSESDSDISIELDEDDINTSWNESECTKIELTQTSANINGSGAAVENNKVTITEAGTYVLSGTLTDGCIDVNVSGKGTVRLILNGDKYYERTTAPFIVEDAKKVVVTLADGTTNTFTDSTRVAAWMMKVIRQQFTQRLT